MAIFMMKVILDWGVDLVLSKGNYFDLCKFYKSKKQKNIGFRKQNLKVQCQKTKTSKTS